ncbi:DNA gyrase/topoisomerase IV [Catovirus CTV1]|uniref:DNA topoisomerase 2 n=1 Tax=Catovirus CTV1 TaxID=1977631 RepID=A0A1V0SBJ6_9VIRU|nr:DNA gyrase/topoisomerase IV [Catovirus CTV1]
MSSKNDSKTPSIEETYKKRNVHEAVLKEPDMWMGSIHMDKKHLWVYDEDSDVMVNREVEYIPGLYKIYDEILVNARDQTIRDRTCKIIKVYIDEETGVIRVWNDGTSIPVEIHKEYNIYVPELIFANLLTSANYDRKGKTTGGKNGLGAKLANIFSSQFTIKIVDSKNKKYYEQKCENNMYKINKPTITNSKDSSYIEISFLPDYEKFKLKGLTSDLVALFKKRVYDIAGCTNKNVKVFLNDKEIKIKSFEDYIGMFYDKKSLIYEEVNDRWRIGAIFDPTSGFNQITFVNGISTFQGGTHVSYITDQICKKIIDHIKIKHKKVNVKPSHIRENLTIFIDCVIEDPSFNSQTKDFLGSKASDYGSSCEVSDTFIKGLIDAGLVEEVVRLAEFKEESELKKTDGKKVASLSDIPKYERATWAGTRKSKYCRLILTEGDSAKSFALAGLDIVGKERYGVFPLKGKPINVREAAINSIKNNAEFTCIKKILGLKQGVKYTDVSKLRYGGIIILTDADVDGSHIKGLILNMFHRFWPSLLKIKGFIQSMATPIIKVFKKNDTKKNDPKIFYTIADYKHWLNEVGSDISKWSKPKYYKGLGTSTEKEAKQCFTDFENKVINYVWELSNDAISSNNNDQLEDIKNDEEDDDLNDDKSVKNDEEEEQDDVDINDMNSKSYDAITLAFEKKRANDRKVWIGGYSKNNVIENHYGDIPISKFINEDLIHFSVYDNIRSIPSVCDGFKPSQRKILYASFKRKIDNEEIKVAQLGAYVAEKTDYHHGENSLYGAIIGMAQNFVGSNNINLLYPSGNFGSRREGGNDAASPRYIFTKLSNITRLLFREEDEPILKKQYEDDNEANHEIEPEYFCPILPYVLICGACGVGTGYSTNIPSFNPKDVANNILRMLENKDPMPIHPWYRGFTGKIQKIMNDKNKENIRYQTIGTYEIVNEDTVRITELPIGEWTEYYCQKLAMHKIGQKKKESVSKDDDKKKKSADKQFLVEVQNNSGNNKINIEVTFAGKNLQTFIKNGTLENELKLMNTISLSNMHLYNHLGKICKYDIVEDIFYDFYNFRLQVYRDRKNYMIKHLENKMRILQYKVQFIKDYIKEKIVVKAKSGDEVIRQLEKLAYPRLSTDFDALDDDKTYSYLTSMAIWSLTQEKINDIEAQYNKAKDEYNTYLNTPVEEIWKREIVEFLEGYEKWLIEVENDDNCDDVDKSKKTKKNTKQKTKIKVKGKSLNK